MQRFQAFSCYITQRQKKIYSTCEGGEEAGGLRKVCYQSHNMLTNAVELTHRCLETIILILAISVVLNVGQAIRVNKKMTAQEHTIPEEDTMLRRSNSLERHYEERFHSYFVPISRLVSSLGVNYLLEDYGAYLLLAIWSSLVVFLSLVSAHDVYNGHFTAICFVCGSLVTISIPLVAFRLTSIFNAAVATTLNDDVPPRYVRFDSPLGGLATINNAVVLLLKSGQTVAEVTFLIVLTSFYVVTLALGNVSLTAAYFTDNLAIGSSLCGLALGVCFITLLVRIGGGLFSESAFIGMRQLTLQLRRTRFREHEANVGTDSLLKDTHNPLFLAALLGEILSSCSGPSVDAASGLTVALVSYLVVGNSVPELSSIPHFVTSLYPFSMVFSGLLITSLLSRLSQIYMQGVTVDELPHLKVLLIKVNRLALIAFAALMVPLTFVLAYATTPGSLNIADISVQSHNEELANHVGGGSRALDADTIAHYPITMSVGAFKVGCVTSLGTALGVGIALLSDIGYGPRSKATADMLRAAGRGEATLASTASALGHQAVLPLLTLVAVACFLATSLAGAYGLVCLALGMASLAPMIVTQSSTVGCGVNALVRASSLHPDLVNIARALNEAALSSAAMCRGFDLTFSVVQVLGVGAAFTYKYSKATVDGGGNHQHYKSLDVLHPLSLAFLIVGVAFPHTTMGSITRTVTATASIMVDDAMSVIRGAEGAESKSTDEEEGRYSGESAASTITAGQPFRIDCPELVRGVTTATTASLRHLLTPALLNTTIPLAIAVFCGTHSLFGFLLGGLLSSFSLAIPLGLTGYTLELARFCLEGQWSKRLGEHQNPERGKSSYSWSSGSHYGTTPAISSHDGAASAVGNRSHGDGSSEPLYNHIPSPSSGSASTRDARAKELVQAAEVSRPPYNVLSPALLATIKLQAVLSLVFLQVFLSIGAGRGLLHIPLA